MPRDFLLRDVRESLAHVRRRALHLHARHLYSQQPEVKGDDAHLVGALDERLRLDLDERPGLEHCVAIGHVSRGRSSSRREKNANPCTHSWGRNQHRVAGR